MNLAQGKCQGKKVMLTSGDISPTKFMSVLIILTELE